MSSLKRNFIASLGAIDVYKAMGLLQCMDIWTLTLSRILKPFLNDLDAVFHRSIGVS